MLGLNMVNTSVLRNNLAFGPLPTANLTGTDDKFNSWDLPVQVSAADFQSISITGMDGPRQADGSLPIVAFLRLLPGSDLIDKGVDIGQPFTGAAPDLGAYEGALLVAGSGGMNAGGAGAGTGGDGVLRSPSPAQAARASPARSVAAACQRWVAQAARVLAATSRLSAAASRPSAAASRPSAAASRPSAAPAASPRHREAAVPRRAAAIPARSPLRRTLAVVAG